MIIPTIPLDKANHIAYGALIAFIGLFHSPLFAIIGVLLFGTLKEVLDRISKKGTPDFMDALATFGGGALVIVHWFLPFAQ